MDGESLAAGAEVAGGSQRIAADENASFRPPERDLLPPVAHANEFELERRDWLLRDDVVRDAETTRERSAITVVAVEQLEHTRRLAGSADAFLDSLGVNRIDQPDALVDDQSM
jgi:hypothetical protein